MAARKENGIYVVRETMKVSEHEFDGTAEDLKRNIDLIVEKARAKGMIGEGRFDFDLEKDFYGNYGIEVTYDFDRVENDKEKTKREATEAKMKKDKAEKRKKAAEARKLKEDTEYTEFLRLKQKFKDI